MTTLSDVRKMRRQDILKLNKDVLADCIISSSDNEALSRVEQNVNNMTLQIENLKQLVINNENNHEAKLRDMQSRIDKQGEILMKQQLYLEGVDRKERETNLIVLGVPEEGVAVDGAESDNDKLDKIWEKVNDESTRVFAKRLGNVAQHGRKRPILVRVRTRVDRDSVLSKAKDLKEAGETFKTIYIKKDVHPAVRKEWARLREAEKLEKDKPENRGTIIRLDTRERKLYKDDVVIDSWTPHPF